MKRCTLFGVILAIVVVSFCRGEDTTDTEARLIRLERNMEQMREMFDRRMSNGSYRMSETEATVREIQSSLQDMERQIDQIEGDVTALMADQHLRGPVHVEERK